MHAIVVGGSGGIGRAFVENLARQERFETICATFYRNSPKFLHPKVSWQSVNVVEESSVRAWSRTLGEVDWLINTAGILHTPQHPPEKTVLRVEPDYFLQNMSINALPSLLLAKYTQNGFKHGRPAVFATVSARVGSIEDNRLGGWYSYRASKAALNMCIKTLALEWRRTLPNITVAALHPGTTDTALSKPFQKNVPKDKLFSPERSAGNMLNVLDSLTPDITGRFWSYDGKELPW